MRLTHSLREFQFLRDLWKLFETCYALLELVFNDCEFLLVKTSQNEFKRPKTTHSDTSETQKTGFFGIKETKLRFTSFESRKMNLWIWLVQAQWKK